MLYQNPQTQDSGFLADFLLLLLFANVKSNRDTIVIS